MSIQKSLKNAMLAGSGLVSWHNNMPTQYSGKQHQYYSPETRTFTQLMAQYSSDFVEAQIQGINPDNPMEWQTRLMRFADIVKPNAAIQRNFDDYKMILMADRDIEYIAPGSKIVTMGSTWLVVNPENISGGDGSAIVRRCNAVWNHFDYYGNVVSEPIIVENTRANANDSDQQASLIINKGYFNVRCQYNDATRQIDTNTRLILGTGAYRVTGYSDFEQEFTGDYSTIRILSFTVRYEETNGVIDDMDNHVAGGKAFLWDISVSGQSNLHVGATAQLTAQSIRNGETVASTAENPISYDWESSDESIVTVDENGFVTATGEGSATVRVKLSQNTAWHTNFAITVTETADGVEFTSTVPQTLGAYESVTLTAAYFEDGEEMPDVLAWTLTGASQSAYSASVNGNSITITCYGYSASPLNVEAAANGYTASAEITLEGI